MKEALGRRPPTRSSSTKKALEDRSSKSSLKSKNIKTTVEDVTNESDNEESEDETEVVVDSPDWSKIKYNKIPMGTPAVVVPVVEGELPFANVPAVKIPTRKDPVPDRTEPISEGPINPKRGPAYTSKAPVEDPEKSKKIIEKILDSTVALSASDLLGVSKGIRDGVRAAITRKRLVQDRETKLLSTLDEVEQIVYVDDPDVPVTKGTLDEQDLKDDIVVNSPGNISETLDVNLMDMEDIPPATWWLTPFERGGVPCGSVIIDDPVENYLSTFPGEGKPKIVLAARESDKLRTIYPVVNGKDSVECVLDGGSQIVSMSKSIAEALGVNWDPDICIHMQSANKQLNRTLGLAKNIPFAFHDITVYLQVHVIDNPAYKILLGRPFDTVTRSEIQNARDGSQLITITDPNSGRRSVLPTFEKGKRTIASRKSPSGENKPVEDLPHLDSESESPKEQNFRRSMIL